MPIDIMYGTPILEESTMSEYATSLKGSLEAAYERVHDQMGHKQDRQKELYDRRVHGEPFEPGDLVWLHCPAVPRGQSRKLHRPWTGPFRVVRKLSDATYRIQKVRVRRQRLVVHFDRLKPCPSNIHLPDAEITSQASKQKGRSPTPPPLGTDLEIPDTDDPIPPPREPSAPNVFPASCKSLVVNLGQIPHKGGGCVEHAKFSNELLCNTVVMYPYVMLYCPIVVLPNSCVFLCNVVSPIYHILYLDLSSVVISSICMLYSPY